MHLRQLAKKYSISPSTARNHLRQARVAGSAAAAPSPSDTAAFAAHVQATLNEMVRDGELVVVIDGPDGPEYGLAS
jgi:transposase-like protein